MDKKKRQKRKYCAECFLNSDIFGVNINNNGLCQECVASKKGSKLQERYKSLVLKAEKRFSIAKKKNSIYDVLVMFSGGKDSAYLLHLLKNKYQLNPLAFCVSVPFLSCKQLSNITEISRKLKVDLIKFVVEQEMYLEYIKFGLSNFGKQSKENNLNYFGCSLCRYIINIVSYNFALRLGIPIIAAGIDKNQSTGPVIDIDNKRNKLKKKYEFFGRAFNKRFRREHNKDIYRFNVDAFTDDQLPDLIYPFTFFEYSDDLAFNSLSEVGIKKNILNSGKGKCCTMAYYFIYLSYKINNNHSHIKILSRKIRKGQKMRFGRAVMRDKKEIEEYLNHEKAALFYLASNQRKDINYEKFNKMFPMITKKDCKEMVDIYNYLGYFKDAKFQKDF